MGDVALVAPEAPRGLVECPLISAHEVSGRVEVSILVRVTHDVLVDVLWAPLTATTTGLGPVVAHAAAQTRHPAS